MPEPIKRIKQEIKKRGYGVLGIIVLAGGMIFTEEEEMPILPRIVVFTKTNITDEDKKAKLELMLTEMLRSYGEDWEDYVVEISDNAKENEEGIKMTAALNK
jgi:hypothetical protein